MNYVTLDCESHLIKPGLTAPKMVCLSFAPGGPDKPVGLVDRERGLQLIADWLTDDSISIVGHNIFYDLGLAAAEAPDLLEPIFQKFENGMVLDTQVRQMMIDIAEGELKFHYDEDGELVRSSYHLADLSYRLNKRFVRKGSDTWRLKYALLDGVPIDAWPDDAKKYACDDAEITLEVKETQDRIIETVDWTVAHPVTGRKVLMNSAEQHKYSWALHLMSAWGLRTDAERVAKLKADLEVSYAEFMEKLRPTEQEIIEGTNLYNITPARTIRVGKRKGEFVPEKVSKNMKAIYARVKACFDERGEDTPLTDKGQISTSRKTLKATDDPRLKLIADAGFTYKLLTTYVPVLERGTRVPINCRYNSPMETGRTSASSPNVQNPPRDGGVRECFIPRKGWVYAFCDYKTLELCALAQVCLDILGKSTMAEAIRRGDDLHLSLAAQLLNIPVPEAKRRYEAGDPEVKGARQQAKVANFGFPGGLGVTSFMAYAEGVGLIITYDQAQDLRAAWFATWPEMHDYFDYISTLTEMHDQMTQLRSGRVRGGCTFTQAANGYFQGLAADGAKEALWRVSKECYIDKNSPLYGCRPVLFLHDEIALEVPYSDPARASAAARRLSQVMIEAMGVFIPDVPITADATMCRRWFKGSEPVTVNGLLVPCRPEKVDGKTRWVADIEPSPLAANQLKPDGLLAQLLQSA